MPHHSGNYVCGFFEDPPENDSYSEEDLARLKKATEMIDRVEKRIKEAQQSELEYLKKLCARCENILSNIQKELYNQYKF